MIEELELIKQLVGELTGAGIWVFVGVVGYKLVKLGVIVWFFHSLIGRIFTFVSADISKDEANRLKSRILQAEDQLSSASTKHETEMNEVKAMYKILKEANDVSE
jgi:phosphate/sulfate permease